MWSHGHNVNLLGANANWLLGNTTGSGIYGGRAGALKVFVSEISTSKVLVAKVPIELPSENKIPIIRADEDIRVFSTNVIEDRRVKPFYDEKLVQMDMDLHTVKFMDFSKRTTFDGTVCNNGFCCNYDIKIANNSGSKVNRAVCIFCLLDKIELKIGF